jgi:hypothetical protein
MKSAFKVAFVALCSLACLAFPAWLFFESIQTADAAKCTNDSDEVYPCKWKTKEDKDRTHKDRRADCKARGKQVEWLDTPQCVDSGDPDDCVTWICSKREAIR